MDRDEENQLPPSDMADAWAEEAANWNEDPAVVAYADAAWASLLASVPVGSDTRVLDFGCGTGLLTVRLAPRVREVVAVDASPAMVEVLARKALPNVRFGVAKWTPETISDDELAAGPFDLIVCSSVCAFLDDYPGAVAMLADRLAPSGYFVQWECRRSRRTRPRRRSRIALDNSISGLGCTLRDLVPRTARGQTSVESGQVQVQHRRPSSRCKQRHVVPESSSIRLSISDAHALEEVQH